MVGGNIPGETRTLSVAIYDRMQAFDDRSAGIMAATLRSIAGLYRPGHGVVRSGSDTWTDTASGVFAPPHQRALGFVFQEYALFPHLTAAGNVMTTLGHRPRAERPARAEQLLAPRCHHSPVADENTGAIDERDFLTGNASPQETCTAGRADSNTMSLRWTPSVRRQ